MFKKVIVTALTFMLTLSLAACAPASETGTSAPTTGTTAAPTTTIPATTKPEAPAFKEIVLADNEDVTVKITSIEEDAIFGYTLKVFLENKTDKELIFTVDDVSVNGFMCDPFWAQSVAAGKKSNSSLSWLSSSFEENGIELVEDINFTLRVYDSDDFLAEDVFEKTFTIHP